MFCFGPVSSKIGSSIIFQSSGLRGLMMAVGDVLTNRTALDGVSFTEVVAASKRIAPIALRTPVSTCSKLNSISGHQLFFKCENLQKAGAFKFRGACNTLASMRPEQLKRGVVTHSSGNHAGALALAAKMFGTKATIVMPTNSIVVKRDAVIEYGGNVVSCQPNQADREATAARVEAETGAILVPPYDHPDIIAGQGTAAMELCEQVGHLDLIVAPVGGGGLLAGTCVAAKGIRPDMQVFGAEPVSADDAFRSKARGELVFNDRPQTIADGLRTNLGEWTWPIIRDQVTGILTIEEHEIVATMRLFWERTKLLIEPSSAVAVAASLYKLPVAMGRPLKVGVILSGGNVDLDHLPW
jgi:threonine dehydratase